MLRHRLHKGIAYFGSIGDAERAMDFFLKMPRNREYRSTARVVSYGRGHAIQTRASGDYFNGDGVPSEVAKRSSPRSNPPMRDNQVLLGVTYQVVTPESAEHGDVAEEGWEREMESMRFRDAVDYIMRTGPYGDPQRLRGDELIFYGTDSEVDFRTGAEKTYDIIVRGRPAVIERLVKWYHATPNRRRGNR
jgi:hypothetical protein